MNGEQERRSNRWLTVFDEAPVADGMSDEQRAKIDRATEREMVELKQRLQELFTVETARQGLLEAIESMEDFEPPDPSATYPRWKGTTGSSLSAKPPSDTHKPQWFSDIDSARKLHLNGESVESFLKVCGSLCTLASRVQADYRARSVVARKRGQAMKADRAKKFPWLSGLAGSKRAVTFLAEQGLCSAAEAERFHAEADRFLQIAENAFPRGEPDWAPAKAHVTQLGRFMMTVFMRVGFSNELGAFYASAFAARYGFALRVNTMKAFPALWESEQRWVTGEPPGSSDLA